MTSPAFSNAIKANGMKPLDKPSTSYSFNPSILREYDIRGQVGKTLSEADAYALGRAFGTYVQRGGGRTCCVGYDGRHSSPAMSTALIKGLSESGLDVTNVGLGPSPMLYFAVKDKKADAGIMVTGSHNPPDYNGFKMMLSSGPVYGEMIQEIGRIAASGDLVSGLGLVSTMDVEDDYIARLMKDYTDGRKLNIAWDAGNGAAGAVLQKLVRKLPGQHTLLYADIDGDFPNHHPDPTVDKNLVDLIKAVKKNKCDLGIAFDGDGDRIGVVDEKGNVLRCDILMTIYAREVLANNPGASIIGDVKCSQVMFDEIARLGGQPVMWKTGHSLIKAKMAETNAPLAGELSGHIFFADKYYGFDDALYCSIRLINALAAATGGLSILTKDLPTLHSTPEARFEVDEADKFNIVARVAESLRAQDGLEVNEIDGVRVSTSDGWWLLRASNTQNVLVARAESASAEGLDRLVKMATNEVKAQGYRLKF
jgi:phosphomannomutase